MARSDVSPDGMRECRGTDLLNVDTETDENFPRLEERRDQLLPGILDEITVDHITTKLAWTELNVLSSLSPGWKEAFDSHRIFAARVRSQSAKTVFVHNHSSYGPTMETIAVYSMKHDHCYELPTIPQVDKGIPEFCECISLNAKLYILGGKQDGSDDARKEVYVYDLLGQGAWKQCASMQSGRERFGCGVLDGKIYVFGGLSVGKLVPGSEVYDPETNAWLPIRPLTCSRYDHHVATSGEELFVHGGYTFPPSNPPLSLEVYQPSRDQWQVRDPFPELELGNVFMAEGKFYSITWDGVYVHDSDANTWKQQHSNSFVAVLEPAESFDEDPAWAIGVVNEDELLFGVWKYSIINDDLNSEQCLLQCKGFGSAKKELVWEIVDNCTSFEWGNFHPTFFPTLL